MSDQAAAVPTQTVGKGEYVKDAPTLGMVAVDLAAMCVKATTQRNAVAILRGIAPDDYVAFDILTQMAEYRALPVTLDTVK